MKQQKKVKCKDCGKMFKRISTHMMRIHPYIPPPLPKKTMEELSTLPNLRYVTLLNGKNFEIGDVFRRREKCIVRKIIKTEGSNNAEVWFEVAKSSWEVWE